MGRYRALKQYGLSGQEGGSSQCNEAGCDHEHKDAIYEGAHRREQYPCQYDMKNDKYQEGTVYAPCKIDHDIERQEIEGDLDMGKQGEGFDVLGLNRVEASPCNKECGVIQNDQKNDYTGNSSPT